MLSRDGVQGCQRSRIGQPTRLWSTSCAGNYYRLPLQDVAAVTDVVENDGDNITWGSASRRARHTLAELKTGTRKEPVQVALSVAVMISFREPPPSYNQEAVYL